LLPGLANQALQKVPLKPQQLHIPALRLGLLPIQIGDCLYHVRVLMANSNYTIFAIYFNRTILMTHFLRNQPIPSYYLDNNLL